MEKIKGLFIGDMVAPTGFSRVLHSVLMHLDREKIDILGLGVNYRGDPHNYPYQIFPALLGGDLYGLGRVNSLIENFRPDFVFIINDAWVIAKYLETIKKLPENIQRPKIVTYFPVDSEEHNPSWYDNFDIVDRVVVYTQFGYDVVHKIKPDMDISIIPHGVDTKVFFKKFEKTEIAKAALFGQQKPELVDSFIVLNANRNQPRKRLDVTIKGFSQFAKDKPENVKLYMHCGIRDSAIEIPRIAARYHVDDRLIITNTRIGVQTVTDEKLNLIYNACDVGINTSMGEGWGLTSIEHAITGAPQIVPDHSACRELFSDCGILMPIVAEYTFDNIATVGKLVNADGVANALQQLYDDRKLYKTLSKKTLEKFSAPEYQWINIAKQWEELFLGLK